MLIIRDAARAVTVPGTVTGYRRRPGIDGALDHPVIEYAGPGGGQVRLDSRFGMRVWQRLAPWRLGARVSVRTDGGRPRHHAPRATCVMVGLVTAFLVILVLVAG